MRPSFVAMKPEPTMRLGFVLPVAADGMGGVVMRTTDEPYLAAICAGVMVLGAVLGVFDGANAQMASAATAATAMTAAAATSSGARRRRVRRVRRLSSQRRFGLAASSATRSARAKWAAAAEASSGAARPPASAR